MQLELDAVPSAIRHGRHWVVEQARAGGATHETARVVELLTSELVTNAVKYGPPDGTITVRVGRRSDCFHVVVSDQGTGVPVARRPGPTEAGGRGLKLVETLAEDWGVQVHARSGKSVWFRVPL